MHVCDGSDRQKDLYLNIQFSGKLTSDRIFGNQSSAAVVLLALGSVQEYAPEYATLEEVQRRIFLPPTRVPPIPEERCSSDSKTAKSLTWTACLYYLLNLVIFIYVQDIGALI